RIAYPHRYALDGESLRMTAAGGSRVTLSGLPDLSVRFVDITDPDRPIAIAPEFVDGAGGGAATVNVGGRATRTLFAFTRPRTFAPEDVVPDVPSTLKARRNAADMIVIAHPTLLAAVEPLVALRRAQGLAVEVVDVTDVYDEFAAGQRTPYAVRD